MTVQAPIVPRVAIPETAPFSLAQREWLSGFFTAALAPLAPAGPAEGLALPGLPAGSTGPVLADNDAAPWHDPSMPADERMALAKDAPPAPRLMAAMAQQDCGQCGYNCADYANALFLKKEDRLNLCVPGGKETLRLVKQLVTELPGDASAGAGRSPAIEIDAPPAEPGAKPLHALGESRESPAEVTFLSRRRLNGGDSEKETFHVEFDIASAGLSYRVGDSFGLFPKNDLGHVDQIIAMLGAVHTVPVRGRPLREVLVDEVSLGLAPDSLFELYSYILGGAARDKARALARGEDPDGDAATLDVFAVVQKFAQARPHPEAFVDVLEPLQPRLYSISSSPAATPGRLSLTVDAVRYLVGRRKRLGVASTFIGHRAREGDVLKAYVQKAHNFALPADPKTPVVMVGPGTGVAPFRAFLHERQATGAPGPNWLFYGHRQEACDFFYRDELEAMRANGHLTRLALAWSRDGAQKVYVQDRIREAGSDLWQWLAGGAHFYVCGDAKRMAKDVEAAVVEVVAQHGARTTDEAVMFVQGLKKAGRYQADVY
ncbi:sulfite reductase subunit alpha [Aurantimonas sp. MSK8Z-1]|uniref:sulfite reductase subunit alpha n=1 Tax=Mangrovibrevibacter kandeliae TaxID=2968473 RepID=UPI002118C492|nr:sulfite reductase subunit alpha [Aurantimonas sp. MSK8Z-1]MCW4115264.1 sulfite reductase subunit alpha [Aurantimonas sp. MSK8Z-1]